MHISLFTWIAEIVKFTCTEVSVLEIRLFLMWCHFSGKICTRIYSKITTNTNVYETFLVMKWAIVHEEMFLVNERCHDLFCNKGIIKSLTGKPESSGMLNENFLPNKPQSNVMWRVQLLTRKFCHTKYCFLVYSHQYFIFLFP